MRTRTLILTGALLLASNGVAQAQQTTPRTLLPTSPTIGTVDFGYRGDSLSGDEARYNRFRDLRDGAFLDRFRYNKETETWYLFGEAHNVGYRDQRYTAGFSSIGRLKASFEWNQVPLFMSTDTRTLYTHRGNGLLAIDDAVQQALQGTLTSTGGATRDTTAVLSNFLTGARQYDMRSRRDLGRFDLVYTFNRDVDFKFNLRNSSRNGTGLQSFGFGTSPGLNPSVELPIPIDDRTTDIRGGVEFANTRGLLAVGYDASWYDNSIPTVRFENPLRYESISNGSALGQAVMWPTNNSVAFNVNGSYKLPARSRATAAISIGRWKQDEALVTPTVNTALVAPPLERASAETKANILSMVYGFNSRPTNTLWLNARYRYYDYDNKTPIFDTTGLIGDTVTPSNPAEETEPASFQRHNLDLDASFSPVDFLALGVGYGREQGDRSFRIWETTTEDILRASIDSTGNQYYALRLKYEYSSRSGSGFEEHLLEEVGEHPEMQHFDIANRNRYRVTGTLTVNPIAQLGFNASVGTGKDDFEDSGFGLRDNKNRTWSLGFDYVPQDTVSLGLNYGYEKYTAFQKSRTAVPLGNASGPLEWLDPRRDWSIDSDDTVKTISANLDLLKTFPKTDIRIGYDLSDGKATYVYATRPDAPRVTIRNVENAVPIPVQLSPLKNKLTGARLDVQYFVRPNVALGVAYWFEDYAVEEFSLNTATINQLNPVNADPASTSFGMFANTIYSGYLYRDYTAHTAWLRMTYLW